MPYVDVLVVEDDADLAEIIGIILTDAGYSNAHAIDGEDAQKWVGGHIHHPGMILTDLCMPMMDGCSFIQWADGCNSPEAVQIRRAPHRNTPIPYVIMSAARESIFRCIDCPHPFLKKPFSANDLLEQVKRCLGK